MKKIEAIIFDMDGTLYRFPDGKDFGAIPFGRAIKNNILTFTKAHFSADETGAQARLDDMRTRWGEEFSLAFEHEHGVPREHFFERTWNMKPRDFISFDPRARSVLQGIGLPIVVLTAAPRVWAEQVLRFIGIDDLVGEAIITGDQDVRKPNPEVFLQAAALLGGSPSAIVSIGDQEHTDILPAKQLGMMTLRIGESGTDTQADMLAPDIGAAIQQLQERNML